MSKFIKNIIKMKLDGMFAKFFEDKESATPRTPCIHGSDIIKPDKREDGKSDYRFCYRECVLKHFYDAHEEKKNNSYLNKIFLNGWVLHEKWQMLLEKYAEVIAIEKTIWDDEFKVAYTPDAHIKMMGKEIIVEIKGWKQEEYDKYDEEGPCPESPLKQALVYCFLTGVKHAIVLVESKNTQAFKLWYIDYDDSLIVDIIERLAKLKQYIAEWEIDPKKLPEKLCKSKTEERAKSCGMCKVCFASDKTRVNYVKQPRIKEEEV